MDQGGLTNICRIRFRAFLIRMNCLSLMRQAGFEEVTYKNLTGGIAALHLGRRPQ